MIEEIISIARKAGRIIIDVHESGDLDISVKNDNSPITRADYASNEYIQSALRNQFRIPVITEESEICYSSRKNWNEFFLVDPLDGTKDYIEQRDDFTVNIALVRNRRPVLGVICVPMLKEIFFSEEGKGAFVEKGGQLKQLPLAICSGMVLARSQFHDLENMDRFAYVNKITQSLSMSSAVRFCRLAEGKVNLYPGLNYSMEWDTAAGQIILIESGGQIIDLKTGHEPVYNKSDFRNTPFIAFSKEICFDQLVLPYI